MELNDRTSYQHQLVQLPPPGAAWPRDSVSVLASLLGAFGDPLSRVEERLAQLIAEYDPRTTYELLVEWEMALGLPDACAEPAASLDARRALIWRKLAYAAGQTPSFYIALAASIGFEIEIHEFDPDVDDYDPSLTAAIAGGRWRYVWRVHVLNAGDFSYARIGDPVGVRLVEGDAAIGLECILTAAKPAHTHVIFSYPEV